jgi:taurine dioxygenase
MVICHPISGHKALYVNPDFTVRIDGLPEDESRELLD